LIASRKIDVKRLITNQYTFEQAEEAFGLVRQGKESVIKVIIGGVASLKKLFWLIGAHYSRHNHSTLLGRSQKLTEKMGLIAPRS
jgi:hypothetical protein